MKQLLLLILIPFLFVENIFANAHQCLAYFSTQRDTESRPGVRRKSELEVLEKYMEALKKIPSVKNSTHPKLLSTNNNQGGAIQRVFEQATPELLPVTALYSKAQQNYENIDIQEYVQLRNLVLDRAFKMIHASRRRGQNIERMPVYSLLDTLHLLHEVAELIEIRENKLKAELEPKVETKQEEKKKEEEEEQKKPPQPPKPRSQLQDRLDRDYTPNNKQLEGGGEGDTSFFAYLVNSPVPMNVVKASVLEVWVDAAESKLTSSPHFDRYIDAKPSLTGIQKTDSIAKIDNSEGKSNVILRYAYGQRPILQNYGAYAVTQIREGTFAVTSTGNFPLPKEILLYYTSETPQSYSTQQLAVLTKKSGIDSSAWAEHVLQGIENARKNGGGDITRTSEILSDWFRMDGPFLYYNKSKRYAEEFERAKAILDDPSNRSPSPVKRAQAAMFNCDGAAEIGMLLLRDFFGYPARFVRGNPVKGYVKDIVEDGTTTPFHQGFHVIDINSPGHAWVEVLINGKWVPFDFTPSRNNPEGGAESKDKLNKSKDPLKRRDPPPEDNDKGSKSESEDQESGEKQSDDTQDGKEDKKQSQQQTSESPQKADDKEPEGHGVFSFLRNLGTRAKKAIQQAITRDAPANSAEADKKAKEQEEQRAEQARKEAQEKADKIEQAHQAAEADARKKAEEEQAKKDAAEADKKAQEKQTSAKQRMTETRTTSEFTFLPENYNSPLKSFIKNLVLSVLRTLRDKGDRKSTLAEFQGLTSVIAEEDTKVVTKALLDLKTLLDPFYLKDDKPIADHLNEAKQEIYANVSRCYDNLLFIVRHYESLSKIRNLSDKENDLVSQIKTILSQLKTYRHINSKQHKAVETVLKNLPGQLIKTTIMKEYPDALEVGSADQNRFFEHLMSGRWAGAIQAYLVNKNFNFLVNAELEFLKRRVQTIIKTQVREQGNTGIVQAEISRPGEMPRWNLGSIDIVPDAVEAILGPVIRGVMGMTGYVEMMEVASPHTPIERKLVVVALDVSGSMQGPKARTQASACAAILDLFMSEVDPFGDPVNMVIIAPFGDKVYENQVVVIKNKDEAMAFISSLLESPTQADQGTQFQPVFDYFFKMIHKYATPKEGGKYAERIPMAKSTLVMITDGEAAINLDKVKTDIDNLPREVEPFFNLMLLEGKSDHLASIIKMLENGSGRARGMLSEISSTQISQFIKESNQIELDPEAFVFDATKGRITSEQMIAVSKLQLPTEKFETLVAKINAIKSQMREDPNLKTATSRTFITLELEKLIVLFKSGVYSQEVKLQTVYDIYTHYESWTQSTFRGLSLFEYDLLVIRLLEAASI